MIPNRFPDAGEQPEYNTIDASLWFVHAIARYLAASRDDSRVRVTAWPAVRQILDGYRRGTRYGIRMDQDGLITGGVSGAQLTWMDAKIGDRVVTPRQGKPVEIQALWVRALDAGETLARMFGEASYADQCQADRQRAIASFQQRFWYEQGGYLYDVIDGPEGNDTSLRPINSTQSPWSMTWSRAIAHNTSSGSCRNTSSPRSDSEHCHLTIRAIVPAMKEAFWNETAPIIKARSGHSSWVRW